MNVHDIAGCGGFRRMMGANRTAPALAEGAYPVSHRHHNKRNAQYQIIHCFIKRQPTVVPQKVQIYIEGRLVLFGASLNSLSALLSP
jgi:hypothetical protein